MQKLLLYTFFVTSIFAPSQAIALSDTLYIVKDSVIVSNHNYAQSTFAPSGAFTLQNVILQADVNEEITLHIVNTDSYPHSYTIDGIVDIAVSANSTANTSFTIPTAGTYRYYSDVPYGRLIGASGILQVGYTIETSYFWNLNDVNKALSHDICTQATSTIPIEYDPNLFFINGYFFPNTIDDSTGFVTQSVGDEIIISIINSGNMDHVLHFHGYHVEILNAQINAWQTGWVKDTFPVKMGDGITIKLVPDQAGEYPVHDHNLISVTNAGFYPGGMITRLSISE